MSSANPAPRWSEVQTATPLADEPLEIHVSWLLSWLHESGLAGHEIRAPDLRAIYDAMCLELWLRPQRWLGRNGVAHAFRRRNRHRKRWRWFVFEDGSRHRLHVYPVPLAPAERARDRTLEWTRDRTESRPDGLRATAQRRVAA